MTSNNVLGVGHRLDDGRGYSQRVWLHGQVKGGFWPTFAETSALRKLQQYEVQLATVQETHFNTPGDVAS